MTHPHIFQTENLCARPFRDADIAVLAEFGVEAVARMMTSLTVPWKPEAIRSWVAEARYQGRPGFRAGIYAGDVLVAFVGLGGDPVNIAYAVHPAHQGKGYGYEALSGLLRFGFGALNLDEIYADHFADNPGSGHILRKCGFEKTNDAMAASAARLEPAASVFYRLTKQRFEAQAQKVTP